MCLTFYTKVQNPDSAVETAKNDIVVYKVMLAQTRKKYRSQYIGFEYMLGVTYGMPENWPNNHIFGRAYANTDDGEYAHLIFDGFHSYLDLGEARKRCNLSCEYDLFYEATPLSVVECRIPSGAKYIIGCNGDIVSSRIIIEKEIQ